MLVDTVADMPTTAKMSDSSSPPQKMAPTLMKCVVDAKEIKNSPLSSSTALDALAPSTHTSIPHVLHIIGDATSNVEEWKKLNKTFLVVPWSAKMLKQILVETIPESEKIYAHLNESTGTDNLIFATMVLYAFGGFAVTSSDVPTRPLHQLTASFPASVLVFFVDSDGLHIDPCIIASSSKMLAFITLFDAMTRTPTKSIGDLVTQFFVSASQASKAESLRILPHDILGFFFAGRDMKKIAEKQQQKEEEDTTKIVAEEDAIIDKIIALLPDAPIIFASESGARQDEQNKPVLFSGTNLGKRIRNAIVALPAGKNRVVATHGRPTLIIVDDDNYDTSAPLKAALGAASHFQRAIATAAPGATIVITHTVADPGASAAGSGLDMLIAPQLRVLGAKRIAVVGGTISVWRMPVEEEVSVTDTSSSTS